MPSSFAIAVAPMSQGIQSNADDMQSILMEAGLSFNQSGYKYPRTTRFKIAFFQFLCYNYSMVSKIIGNL
jgi:hypothetical protein